MEPFLARCANYINHKNPDNLEKSCLVFPNRRSGLFFTAYFQRIIPGVVIGPHITTVSDLISGYSELMAGERLMLISILFEIFKKHTHSEERFDEFYFWGETLLSDFNDIDLYMVNAKDLFTNLAGLKEVEGVFDYLSPGQKAALEHFWGSVPGVQQRSFHKNFVSLWQRLYPVYTEFRDRLREARMGYPGMISRSVVEDFRAQEPQFPYESYYVIGLNVLNRCEQSFFKQLKESGKASFFWDFDRSYVEDLTNEAGFFIRENLKHFPPPEDFNLDTEQDYQKKTVKLVAVSSNYGQAQQISSSLEAIGPDVIPDFDNTAIILADESLLFPALGAIPPTSGTVNVTMGYPVRNSVVYGFLNLLLLLLKNRSVGKDGKVVAYHRYVTDLLRHQLLAGFEPDKSLRFLAQMKAQNRVTVTLDEIDFSPMHRLVFDLPGSAGKIGGWMLEILSRIYGKVKESEPGNQLLTELIFSVYQAVEKLDSVVTATTADPAREISIDIYFKLLSQYLGTVSVAFEGEPLRGMQVMGVLETRCLDFKHLIILGLNEGKWPAVQSTPSFIPFNLKKGFGLPGTDERDAMYAYYFFRLIQRAEGITATYSTIKEGIGTGELSRYGFQLLYSELFRVESGTLDFQFSNSPVPPILIEGTKEKLQALYTRNRSGTPLSPTSVNTWLQCKLRFYFRYVLQLPEPEDIKDEIDSPLFGTVFHEVAENIYKPFVGEKVTKDHLDMIRKNGMLIEEEIKKSIGRNYFKIKDPKADQVLLEGKSVLIFENINMFIRRLLEIDREIAPFDLLSLEKSCRREMEISVDGNTYPILLGGKIDRIDRVNGIVRILDYKTGNVDSLSFQAIEDLFISGLEQPRKEILQALIYCWIYQDCNDGNEEVMPAIYCLRKFFNENFSPNIRHDKQDLFFGPIKEDFENELGRLLGSVFMGGTDFDQTSHVKHCQFCPYQKICQRL